MGYKLYATDGTAREISRLGTDVEIVGKLGEGQPGVPAS